MNDPDDLFATAALAMTRFRTTVDERPVAPPVDFDALRDGFGFRRCRPIRLRRDVIVDDLIKAADPGLTATVGPRYFGFVIGGALESATAADMLALGWDQTAFNATLSPASIAVEQVAGGWAKELLGIPASASVGFVTGAQEANTVGLAAARHHVLEGAWAGTSNRTASRSAARPGPGRRRAAQHHRPVAPAARDSARMPPSRYGLTPTARSTSSTWRRSWPRQTARRSSASSRAT